jgi:hypothetical protein
MGGGGRGEGGGDGVATFVFLLWLANKSFPSGFATGK